MSRKEEEAFQRTSDRIHLSRASTISTMSSYAFLMRASASINNYRSSEKRTKLYQSTY